MAIVRCPRCRDEVTVPPGATSRALVRCPLCLEQYLLSEAMANAPPLLVIIGGEVPQAVIDQSAVAGHDYQIAAVAVADSPDNHWGHAATATLTPRAPVIRTGRHARKREPNAILLTFSWLGGGVLSLVLAPLILWWIFKVDPVEIGPTVAAYAPWVVPQQFHGSPATTNVDSEPVQQPTKRRSKKVTTKNAPEEGRPSDTSESQTLPKEDDAPAAATSDSPEIRFKPIDRQPAGKDADTRSEQAQPRPPMPDLTDLLP
ncbi:MAG TPA: hypothetical protein VGI40_19700 [Pirellulaceae bacterium]|jgi:hypothetical protein